MRSSVFAGVFSAGLAGVVMAMVSTVAMAEPQFVFHAPGTQVFGEPAGITGREPETVRDGENAQFWIKIGPSFFYNTVHIYYTTDGSEPQGANGIPGPGTLIAGNGFRFPAPPPVTITFVRNEPRAGGGNDDWWRATLPIGGLAHNTVVKYKISARQDDGREVFANGGQSYQYRVNIAWPGQGAAFPGNEGIGYPPFHSWKEEGVIGNGHINAMLDQNASIFDVYFPGAGGVQGVGTKNEGYVDGLDTFPPLLPSDNRGQMHLNQAFAGIRRNGITHWLTNSNGTSFTGVNSQYVARSNVISTSSTMTAGGANISVQQFDFAPRGISFPIDANGKALQGSLIKRMVLTNNRPVVETVQVYFYVDPAINGGDRYDYAFYNTATNAAIFGDNTYRIATNTGPIGFNQEYNPTTFGSGYEKNVSIQFATAMKSGPVGQAGTRAIENWRETSSDNGQGWIGTSVTLQPGVATEVAILMVGGFDSFAGADGLAQYNFQMAPVVNWFYNANLQQVQQQTDASWNQFLDSGVTVDLPDNSLDTLFERGLLATALHLDERMIGQINPGTGQPFNAQGLIAGFRNGAYPYVWPRDMAWAAVTLSRTGHTGIVDRMTNYLRDVTFRDFESWGRKGFWKQKYTTDGFVVWGAPQVDETAVVPWMVWYQYLVTGDKAYLDRNYEMVKDAAISSSQTSSVDPGRLNLRQAYPGAPSNQVLMYSNNVWEDQYDTFLMSNANILRGLADARFIALAKTSPNAGDASDFQNRYNGLLPGFFGKLDWDGEATDISLLGVVYPFYIVPANDARAAKIIDRINGVRRKFNNAHPTAEPLVRFAGEYINDASDYVGLVDRYWGDGYWGNPANGPTRGGPWFLTTMWYGMYYNLRQDFTAGKGDVDNHLYRLKRTQDHTGPLGLGAEQMAPANSLLYPGQSDFTLQTAWPNAWESMSFFVDAIMGFASYTPDAPGNTLRLAPKLPSGWTDATFRNLRVASNTYDVTAIERPSSNYWGVRVVNDQAGGSNYEFAIRIPAGQNVCRVLQNGAALPASQYTVDSTIGRVVVSGVLSGGAGALTDVRVYNSSPADIGGEGGAAGGDGLLDNNDFIVFINAFFDNNLPVADYGSEGGAFGSDGLLDNNDFIVFIQFFFEGC
jgi:GH15 family glucan-1,4-alpha-glucosidase